MSSNRSATSSEFIDHLARVDKDAQRSLIEELYNEGLSLKNEGKKLSDQLSSCQRQIIESNVLVSKLKEELSETQRSFSEHLQSSAVSNYKLSESERRLEELLAQNSNLSDSHLSTGRGKSELFRIDDRFTGEDRTLYPSFQRQVRIALARNKDRYASLQSQITLVYQNLGPAPKSFLDRYLSDDGDFKFESLDAVWEVLDVSYKNVNEEEEARDSLNSLEQGDRSFGWFLAEFQRLFNLSRISDDKTLISLMRNGVSDELRVRISQHQDIHKSYTFDEYVSLCKDCVIRLNLEKTGRSKLQIPTLRGVNLTLRGTNPTPLPSAKLPVFSSGANTVPLGGDPMVLDQADMSHIGPDGHITPEERQRRFRFKLCMRCGRPGHRADHCKGKGKQRVVQELHLDENNTEEGRPQTSALDLKY